MCPSAWAEGDRPMFAAKRVFPRTPSPLRGENSDSPCERLPRFSISTAGKTGASLSLRNAYPTPRLPGNAVHYATGSTRNVPDTLNCAARISQDGSPAISHF